jgi:hypothetical protein
MARKKTPAQLNREIDDALAKPGSSKIRLPPGEPGEAAAWAHKYFSTANTPDELTELRRVMMNPWSGVGRYFASRTGIAQSEIDTVYRQHRDSVHKPATSHVGKPTKPKKSRGTIEVMGGYKVDLDRRGALVRERIDTNRPGDYGSDPLGDGTFRMVPSGDIVSFEEMRRRLPAPKLRSHLGKPSKKSRGARKPRIVDVVCETPAGYRWLRGNARGAIVTSEGPFAVTNEADWAESLNAAGGTEIK